MRCIARRVLQEEQSQRIHYGLHDIRHMRRVLGGHQHSMPRLGKNRCLLLDRTNKRR